MPLTDIISAAERKLSRRSNRQVGLLLAGAIVDYPGAACTILRASVQQPAPIPATVFIKYLNSGSEPMPEEWAALVL